MMTKLLKSVCPLVAQELAEANKTSPLFNSGHQAYAVIKEEFEETKKEITDFDSLLKYYWMQVKADDPNDEKTRTLNELKQTATLCACEAIQTAAMAQKAIDSMEASK